MNSTDIPDQLPHRSDAKGWQVVLEEVRKRILRCLSTTKTKAVLGVSGTDVAQETLIKAHEMVVKGRFRGCTFGEFWNYCLEIFRSKQSDKTKFSKRQRRDVRRNVIRAAADNDSDACAFDPEAPQAGPEQAVISKELWETYQRVQSEMDRDQQQVLQRYLAGDTCVAIGVELSADVKKITEAILEVAKVQDTSAEHAPAAEKSLPG